MSKKIKFYFAVLMAACILTACALGDRRPPAVQYDLGPLKTVNSENISSSLPVIRTQVQSPEWMNENLMFYRLEYINDQQIRFYTESNWNTSPARLFKNRLDSYLVTAGNTVIEVGTSSPTLTLRIYLEDFSQHFMSPSNNIGRIVLRVSLFRDHDLIAQKRFQKEVASLTADAQGGAKALAQGSDEVIAEMMEWLSKISL